MSRRNRLLHGYVVAVSAAGVVVFVALAVFGTLEPVVKAPGEFWVFTFALAVSEVFPVSVPRGDAVDEVTTSTVFALALMIAFGTGPAAFALASGSIVADMLHGKQTWKAGFNAAQYTLAIASAGAVYASLGGTSSVEAASLPPFVIAALVFFLMNTLLTDVALVMSQDVPLFPYLWRDLVFQAEVAVTLIALSPVVVVVAERSLWLVLPLAAPAAAVYWGARFSLENTRLVGQLQGNLDRMTELNRMKDDFVAVVSHELRTPLTSIQGYIKTLLQLSPELDGKQQRSFLEAADRQSDRLRRLIEQLLVVARLESHEEPIVVSKVNLARLAAVVVDDLRPRAHGHTFDVRVGADLQEVESDEGKLHQILANLVENALKYSSPDTRVTIRAEPSIDGVVLAVEDEGGGIPQEMQDRVFDRFTQVDQSATRRVGGTGLGLYICRKMADALGGRVWLARSDPGGSEFCVFVPARPPARDVDRDDQ